MGRPILFKQVNYRFYRPGALSIASNFAEMPFNMPQIFIFWCARCPRRPLLRAGLD